MPSRIRKHSVMIAGHRTSVSLEPEFWDAFREVAAARGMSVNDLATEVDRARTTNLSSAIRLCVLEHLRARADAGARPP